MSPTTRLLISNLGLIYPTRNSRLCSLIERTCLHHQTNARQVFHYTITTRRRFIISSLPRASICFTLLHGSRYKTNRAIKASKHSSSTLNLQIRSQPTNHRQVNYETYKNHRSSTIAAMVLCGSIITMSTRISNLLRTTFHRSRVVRNVTFPTVLTRRPRVRRRPTIRGVLSPRRDNRFFFRFVCLANDRRTTTSSIGTRSKFLVLRHGVYLVRSNAITTSNRSSINTQGTFFREGMLCAFRVTKLFRIDPRRSNDFLRRRRLHYPTNDINDLFLSKI